MKILIPTCRDPFDPAILEMRQQLIATIPAGTEIIESCRPASASVNRNRCLDRIEHGERAIMLDDDIRGFYPGWLNDLLKGLNVHNAVVASARLMNADGTVGPTCSRCYQLEPEEIRLNWGRPHCILPTAAIAFVYRGHRFDEHFVGSGWEDNDWCLQYKKADPTAEFIQSNRCKLVHLNEMKGQKGEAWEHNKCYFDTKWPNGIDGIRGK